MKRASTLLFSLAFSVSQAQAQSITLDAEGFAGEYTAVAIGQDDRPIVAYKGDGGLRVVHCESTDCSIGTIYDHGDSANEISMTIRSDGRPLIAYRSLGALALRLFDCADTVCSSGTARNIDGGDGRYSAMVIRDDGRPMIAYNRPRNPSALRVYDCVDAQCTDGTIRTLDSGTGPTSLGAFPDIAINAGTPIITYIDGFPNNQLQVYRCNDVDCTTGDVYEVGTNVNSHTAIAVPADGRPLITYYSGRALLLLDCVDADCSSAEQRELDDNNVGAYNALEINADGLAVISYSDSANQALRTYACDDSRCTSGKADTVDISDNVGQYTSIALRPSDTPIITYYDADNTALKAYACGDQRCAETILADGFE